MGLSRVATDEACTRRDTRRCYSKDPFADSPPRVAGDIPSSRRDTRRRVYSKGVQPPHPPRVAGGILLAVATRDGDLVLKNVLNDLIVCSMAILFIIFDYLGFALGNSFVHLQYCERSFGRGR